MAQCAEPVHKDFESFMYTLLRNFTDVRKELFLDYRCDDGTLPNALCRRTSQCTTHSTLKQTYHRQQGQFAHLSLAFVASKTARRRRCGAIVVVVCEEVGVTHKRVRVATNTRCPACSTATSISLCSQTLLLTFMIDTGWYREYLALYR